MPHIEMPQTLVEKLNRLLVVENEEIEGVRRNPDEEQLLPPTGKIVLAKPIDAFISGPCVEATWNPIERPQTGMTVEDFFDSDFVASIESILADLDKPKTVVVYPDCCGGISYPKQYRELYSKHWPDIEWLFADVPDYCGSHDLFQQHQLELLVLRLQQSGVLTITAI